LKLILILFAGGRLVDGSQDLQRSQGNVSSKLHPTNLTKQQQQQHCHTESLNSNNIDNNSCDFCQRQQQL
jgi:hypothetical protein